MVFVKRNSPKSDIFFDPIVIPGFPGSRFFRVQVFQDSGFSRSRFFRVPVRIQGPGSGFWVQVQVSEVAHLEDKSIDTVLLHIGVNDILNDNSKSNVDNLMSNIQKIVEKCRPSLF